MGEILDELDLKGKNDELVKELVKLSTQHGILTPYTSFFADDTRSTTDLASTVQRAGERLEALQQPSGAGGFALRADKARYKYAAKAPAASRPAANGFFGGSAGRSAGPALPMVPFAEQADREAKAARETVRSIGTRTFYRRGDRWVDSLVTKEQEATATRIKQFSDEYFALARRHGKKMSQYMVFDQPVLLTLENRAYLIEP